MRITTVCTVEDKPVAPYGGNAYLFPVPHAANSSLQLQIPC